MIRTPRISRLAAATLIASGFALPALAQGGTSAAAKPAQIPAPPVHRAAAPAAPAGGTARPADPAKPASATVKPGDAKPGTAKPGEARTSDAKPAAPAAGAPRTTN